MLRFTKLHGIGNDYVYVSGLDQDLTEVDCAALARAVSPRRTGIGSDGLILILPSQAADCKMRMFNVDGSEGEMCGNALRCVVKYLDDRGLIQGGRARVETLAGIRPAEVLSRDGDTSVVRVDMGQPSLRAESIPCRAPAGTDVLEHPLLVDAAEYRLTCVSMGNPHGVVFVGDAEAFPLAALGPKFERHEFFPKRANIEFVQVLGEGDLRMRVWERGSGITAACGTGACAALVAAFATGRAGRSATVRLDGGDLSVEWAADGRVLLTGPATYVYSGEWPHRPAAAQKGVGGR